jgi:hypothetical protein
MTSQQSHFQRIKNILNISTTEGMLLPKVNLNWLRVLEEKFKNDSEITQHLDKIRNLDDIISKGHLFEHNDELSVKDLAVEIKGYLDLTNKSFEYLKSKSQNDQELRSFCQKAEKARDDLTSAYQDVLNNFNINTTQDKAASANKGLVIGFDFSPNLPFSSRSRTIQKLPEVIKKGFLNNLKDEMKEIKEIAEKMLNNQGEIISISKAEKVNELVKSCRGNYDEIIDRVRNDQKLNDREKLAAIFHNRNVLLKLNQELSNVKLDTE